MTTYASPFPRDMVSHAVTCIVPNAFRLPGEQNDRGPGRLFHSAAVKYDRDATAMTSLDQISFTLQILPFTIPPDLEYGRHAYRRQNPDDRGSVVSTNGAVSQSACDQALAAPSRIINEHDEASIGQYTNKQAAREQFARVTLVIRDYMRVLNTDRIQSMVADVVDASYHVEGTQDTYNQPIFVNSVLFSREQELGTVMQEQSAESIDDVIELWNVLPVRSNKLLPDSSPRADIGCDVDCNDVLCRSRSKSNLLHHYVHLAVEDIEEWRNNLHDRKLEELDLQWPPVFRGPKPNVGRQRSRTNTSSMPASRAELKVREEATLSRPSRRPTFSSPTPLSPIRSRAL
ncbi:hypothetical protein DOTSEDRAFT_38609 [Dothistroma septosporum NZE10]|uniref:Uncharacterized protein n=1 Tax=Dothistroma septosporum (strain NZE10 / CBS 128990) TaxID=675120 RepID=M2WKC1_DOTSN|nr:hypothetical protein DOTSEDRAFT_38609 [Dothistroma septosporum NZE10]